MTPRLALPEDAPSLARLHRAIFGSETWDEAFWLRAIEQPFDRVLLLGAPARAFGMLRLLGEEAEIVTIGTEAPRRRDGSSLIGAMAALAQDAGAAALFLEVSAANKAAQALYHRHGFREAGLRRGYYKDGSDAVIMRLDLAAGE